MRLRVWRLSGTMLAAAGLGLAAAGLVHGDAQGKTASATRGATTSGVATSGITTAGVTTSGVTTSGVTTSGATSTNPAEQLPGYGKPLILLGDKNTPEQFVLGELYAAALEAQGYRVELTRNIGPPAVAQQALAQGSLDVYPEYLNVWDSQIVGDTVAPDTLAAAYHAGQRYALAHDLALLPPTPFSDTAGVAVTTLYAGGNRLQQISDLIPYEQYLTFGAPLPFLQGPDAGLPALEQAYGFKPANVQQLDVGASYTALASGQVQAAYASTTDPQLGDPDYRLLADPKHVFGIGNIVPVVSQQTLAAEGPAFVSTLEKVDSLLTTQAMRGLNAEVQTQHESAEEVARTFLQGNGVVPPPPWAKNGIQPPPVVTTTTGMGTTTTETTVSGTTQSTSSAGVTGTSEATG